MLYHSYITMWKASAKCFLLAAIIVTILYFSTVKIEKIQYTVVVLACTSSCCTSSFEAREQQQRAGVKITNNKKREKRNVKTAAHVVQSRRVAGCRAVPHLRLVQAVSSGWYNTSSL